MKLRTAVKLLLHFPYLFQAVPKSDRLHIGCGTNILEGWINTDLMPGKGIIHLDATKPLPFRSGQFRYVFCEHFIEHITYQQAISLLRGIYDVLRAGGRVRIATPDFAFLAHLYSSPDPEYIDWASKHSGFPPTALHSINNFVRNWGHQF